MTDNKPMEKEPKIAKVAISNATLFYDKLYSYLVPPGRERHIFVGSVVLVPFGKGKAKPRIGVVLELAGEAEEKTVPVQRKLKEILDVAPPEATLSPEMASIVRYLKEATFCTWFDAVKAVIPFGALYRPECTEAGWILQRNLKRQVEIVYSLSNHEDGKRLTEKQRAVIDYLRERPATREEIIQQCGVGKSVLDTLVNRGYLSTSEQDKERWLADEIAMEQKPAGEEWVRTVFHLSTAQRQVVDALHDKMIHCWQDKDKKPALLYGVTGSGKTVVFLELAQKALQEGKNVLVLVPEIGLTPQMIGKLRDAFGPQVAVQHSKLSQSERYAQWWMIKQGKARVVVGTRTAVFAPLDNIGLLVLDEEQERSYQSESAPRYDAIEVARRRAARHGALLLLASATPSTVSYYYAKSGRYDLFKLEQRYGDLPLPQVRTVDMHEELMDGNPRIISGELMAEIKESLAAEKQVILLLNRRGYHRVGVCRSCHKVLKCTDCSVPMVFHKSRKKTPTKRQEGPASQEEPAPVTTVTVNKNSVFDLPQTAFEVWKSLAPKQEEPDEIIDDGLGDGKLVCHFCGHTEDPAPHMCPECGGAIRYTGFGTQKLESELAEQLPEARVLRMDTDSTTRKGVHVSMLRAFQRGEYDILVGTQMVAKGLDFERVNLVGVIGIDSLLFSQGYRAYETVFSLVTQVVGRSGRASGQGEAVIQTYDPGNPVLVLAARQDYEAFYKQEIAFRKLALYPPFCALCIVGFVSPSENDTREAARAFAGILAQKARENPQIPLRILGPAPMHVAQIEGSWRFRLTLKCKNDAAFRALAMETLEEYNTKGWMKKAAVYLDFHQDGV